MALEKLVRLSPLLALGAVAALWAAVALVAARGAGAGPHLGPDPASHSVLVVMPLTPRSDDGAHGWFGAGVADAVVTRLRRVPGLTVASLASVLDLESARPSPIEAARSLGAAAVLCGDYALEEGRPVIAARLLDAATGAVLWRRTVAGPPGGGAAPEDGLADELARLVAPSVPPGPPAGKPLAPLAHYLAVLARGKIATARSDAVADAVSLLERAIEADPSMAAAHALMSLASVDMFLGGLSSKGGWIGRSLASARRAVRLDPGLPDAHYALGRALMVAGEPVEAAEATLRALELEPGHARALAQLASFLAGAGLSEQGAVATARARLSDPLIEVGWQEAVLAEIEGRMDGEIRRWRLDVQARQASGDSPEVPLMLLAYLSQRAGNVADALSFAASLDAVSRNTAYVDMIRLMSLGRQGRADAVASIVERHREIYEKDWQYAQWIGASFAEVGRRAEALEWLDRSVRLGSFDAWTFDHMPELAPLRGEPRFDTAAGIVRSRAEAVMDLVDRSGWL
ncbi:MAG TPA: tetratricopeptide repeat protein [Candidatus Polarisedimenticolia bacterium]|nr:tetratricopeptide repeat protein [Candidatus Polarisedimenticolia bacterium]